MQPVSRESLIVMTRERIWILPEPDVFCYNIARMGTILAFGPLGTPEIIIIFVIVFLLFGAKKLPELARGIGKSLGEFKKAKNEFQDELMNSETKAQEKKLEENKPVEKPYTNPYTEAQPQEENKDAKDEQK